MKGWINKLVLSIALLIILTACSKEDAVVESKKTIVMGFGPSAYINQFEDSIQPLLEKEGYAVEIKIFSHNKLIPQGLKEDVVDATVHISTSNMHEMNKRLKADMIVWADTASAPQSLRSLRHKTLDIVQDGMTIGVPNDPINMERAVRILEDIAWVSVDPDVETVTFSTQSVHPKKYNLELIPMDAAQLPRAMEDLDFAIINGNYVTNRGERISDGLVVEKSPSEHLVKVVIREVNQNEEWAKAIKRAYESKEFEEYVKGNTLYDGFIYPAHWSE